MPQMPPEPMPTDMGAPMGGDPNMNGGQMPPMGGDPNAMGDEIPPMGNDGGSQFDTGFDAGVEADEDTDPKKFIQQLTGKLSQSLNSYNNENGEPYEELSKYVGKMIVKAAVKGLDEKGRKDLIKAINTADDPEDEEPEEDLEDNTEGEEPMAECGGMKTPIGKMTFFAGKRS